MQIIADLAPRAALADLERLQQDTDSEVARMAKEAIHRLQSQP